MFNRNFELEIKSNTSLEKLNTFGLDVATESLYIAKNLKDLRGILSENKTKKITVLGGGSNILFTKFLDGLCLKIDLKGIDIIEESEKNVVINVMAGENWHDFVQWSVSNGFGNNCNILAESFAIGRGNGSKNLFLPIAFNNFCIISLNVSTSGPTHSITRFLF